MKEIKNNDNHSRLTNTLAKNKASDKPKRKNFCTSQKNRLIIDNRIVVKKLHPCSFNNSNHNFLNSANTTLATSFIENGQREEARAMLVAVGVDELLAEFIVGARGKA